MAPPELFFNLVDAVVDAVRRGMAMDGHCHGWPSMTIAIAMAMAMAMAIAIIPAPGHGDY